MCCVLAGGGSRDGRFGDLYGSAKLGIYEGGCWLAFGAARIFAKVDPTKTYETEINILRVHELCVRGTMHMHTYTHVMHVAIYNPMS